MMGVYVEVRPSLRKRVSLNGLPSSVLRMILRTNLERAERPPWSWSR